MKEYEYSFKVTNVDKFICYCKENNYIKKENVKQTRILYKNRSSIMARITSKEYDNFVETTLDFKDDNNSNEILKVSNETIPLEVNDNNKDAVYSILNILGYKKDKTLVRNRVVYYKDNVTYEIDSYINPEKMFVVAIEGDKNKVDQVYYELEELIKRFKID